MCNKSCSKTECKSWWVICDSSCKYLPICKVWFYHKVHPSNDDEMMSVSLWLMTHDIMISRWWVYHYHGVRYHHSSIYPSVMEWDIMMNSYSMDKSSHWIPLNVPALAHIMNHTSHGYAISHIMCSKSFHVMHLDECKSCSICISHVSISVSHE